MEHTLTICYFGIYNPEFSRNKIYMSALKKQGAAILECQDSSSGLMKFVRLWKKHKSLAEEYDAIIVGYPGHVVVPLAKLISKKKVIFDALGTLYEAEVLSHKAGFFSGLKARIIDWLAVKCADVVLVESEPQRQFFIQKFGISDKCKVVYTSADEEVLEEGVETYNRTKPSISQAFTVLFRGSLTPEAGLDTILKAASILEKNYPEEHIKFRILGRGIYEGNVRSLISGSGLTSVELNTEKLPWPELIALMLECSVSLGQFSTNPRLDRTIPHKAYESMVLKLPYITARAPGISSIIEDGLHCLMVHPADPDDLVAKILELKNSPEKGKGIAESAYRLFKEKLSPTVMAREIISLV